MSTRRCIGWSKRAKSSGFRAGFTLRPSGRPTDGAKIGLSVSMKVLSKPSRYLQTSILTLRFPPVGLGGVRPEGGQADCLGLFQAAQETRTLDLDAGA